MARGKNSPALFEVIRNAQQKQKEQLERQKRQELAAEMKADSPASALLRSPILWLKGKHAHEAAIEQAEPAVRADGTPPAGPKPTPAPAAPPPRPKVEVPVFREVELEKATPTVVSKVTPTPTAAELAAKQVREELAAQEAPAAEPMFAGADYHQPFDADADAEQGRPQKIHLQFNYTTAIVAGFAILVAFVVAYVIGTAGKAEKAALASNGVRRDVLNVQPPPGTPRSTPVTPVVALLPNAGDDGDRGALNTGGDALTLETIGKPIPVPTNVKRIVGLQYIVLMSSPRDEDAKDLVKFLAQHGVAATAEKPLPGPGFVKWTSVVAARGFERTRNNPAFTAYNNALQDLLNKYAGTSKWRKFKTDLYTWGVRRDKTPSF